MYEISPIMCAKMIENVYIDIMHIENELHQIFIHNIDNIDNNIVFYTIQKLAYIICCWYLNTYFFRHI